MKVQHSNPTMLQSIASDNADFMVDSVVNAGLTIDQAVEHYAGGMMEDSYDEDEFEAPYDLDQVKPLLRSALVNRIKNSATNLRNYSSAFPTAYVSDYDSENAIGEPITVRVIEFEGEKFEVIFGDDEDMFHQN